MADLQYFQFPYMSDNYGVLIHSDVTGETAAIDAGDASALLAELKQNGWQLTNLFVTHHHADHVEGLEEVKSATGCKVTGPAQHSNIAGLDNKVSEGDVFQFAGCDVQVLHTPGHTTDMLNYYLPQQGVVFTGDTLFALGCGRLFEGNADMMWQSLNKLMALPAATKVYCSHEYTEANAKFAVTVDPENTALQSRFEEIKQLRSEGKATVPTTIAEELATNPFLRADDKSIRAHLGMADASDAEVFAVIRQRKDNF